MAITEHSTLDEDINYLINLCKKSATFLKGVEELILKLNEYKKEIPELEK